MDTAGAVMVARVDARRDEPAARLRCCDSVARVGAFRISPRHDRGARARTAQRRCGLARRQFFAQQPGGLGTIGRDHGRERHQVLTQGREQIAARHGRARRRTPDRIDDERNPQPPHPPREHAHVVRTPQQPALDRQRRQVVCQRGQLRVQQIRHHRIDAPHRHRVLRSDRRHRRAAVHAEGIEGTQVGLDAGAAAAVRAGHAPDDRASVRHSVNGRPVTGVLATAIVCGAISPASYPSRAPSMASRNARAIATGSAACATAELSSTAS